MIGAVITAIVIAAVLTPPNEHSVTPSAEAWRRIDQEREWIEMAQHCAPRRRTEQCRFRASELKVGDLLNDKNRYRRRN